MESGEMRQKIRQVRGDDVERCSSLNASLPAGASTGAEGASTGLENGA